MKEKQSVLGKKRQINEDISLTYHNWKEVYREKHGEKLKLIENTCLLLSFKYLKNKLIIPKSLIKKI